MSNMTTNDSGIARPTVPGNRDRRVSTETKASVKTSELIAYVLAVLGVLIASAVVSSGDSGTDEGDPFTADKAWLYITILTVGYLLSRGLAKSGSRDFYDDTVDSNR
ncbi:MAG: hypothetical protein ACLGIG_10370 [Actinomycetes bacterium]